MSLLSKIKGQEKPATMIVNDDLIAVEDPARGAPIKAPGNRPAYKPLNPAVAEVVQLEDGQEMIVMRDVAYSPGAAARIAKKPVENAKPPEDDFLDLIMENPPPSSAKPSFGRPRMYASNAERQKAYRDRMRAQGR